MQKKSAIPKNVDEYISKFPDEVAQKLEQLRQAIKKAAPAAQEVISYQMPAYKVHGNLVYFAGYKNHIGFYPGAAGIEAFKKELSVYKGAKGSVQFPLDKSLPLSIVTKIVKFRVKQNLEKAKNKLSVAKKVIAKKQEHFHKDGTLYGRGKMLGNQIHGYWEWFRKDGVIMRSGYFDNGQQTGEWTNYDKQGKVYKVTKMK